MLTIWSRCGRLARSIGGWFYGSWPIAPGNLEGGFGEAQGSMGESYRLRNTKLILTAASIVAVFVGWFMGKDPSQLQIVLPSLIGAYSAANVAVEYVRNKYGNDSGTGTNG